MVHQPRCYGVPTIYHPEGKKFATVWQKFEERIDVEFTDQRQSNTLERLDRRQLIPESCTMQSRSSLCRMRYLHFQFECLVYQALFNVQFFLMLGSGDPIFELLVHVSRNIWFNLHTECCSGLPFIIGDSIIGRVSKEVTWSRNTIIILSFRYTNTFLQENLPTIRIDCNQIGRFTDSLPVFGLGSVIIDC